MMEATLELAGLVVRCCELRCTQEQRLAMRIHGAATELEVVAKVMAVAAEVASPKPKRQTLWCVNAQGGNVKIARNFSQNRTRGKGLSNDHVSCAAADHHGSGGSLSVGARGAGRPRITVLYCTARAVHGAHVATSDLAPAAAHARCITVELLRATNTSRGLTRTHLVDHACTYNACALTHIACVGR